MRLRRPCQHDRYEAHSQLSEGGHPESSIAYFDCPGGEFLPEDALVIEKINGEWPPPLKGWGGLLSVLLDLQKMEAALADQVGEPG